MAKGNFIMATTTIADENLFEPAYAVPDPEWLEPAYIVSDSEWLERARLIDPGDEMPPFVLFALTGLKPPSEGRL
jgi:hypothetical protein